MKKQLIAHIAQRLISYGYTVYIAQSGEYGFYTEGVRVVSFGGQWNFSVDFSGNYRTNAPTQTGTGWQIAPDMGDITEEQARAYITAKAPDWAISGATVVNYTTPEQHLATYGNSSRYTQYGVDDSLIGTNYRTECGHGRASYHPEWSKSHPYATYRDGTAGRHFATLEACAQYFASLGMYLNQEGK